MLQSPGWDAALQGEATEFPQLASALHASTAEISRGVRYGGARISNSKYFFVSAVSTAIPQTDFCIHVVCNIYIYAISS